MSNCQCHAQHTRQTRRISRRTTLHAAGIAAASLVATRLDLKPTSAQGATPAAAVEPGPMPDLRGVAPIRLTGERYATFQAYVAAKLAEIHIPGAAVAVVQNGEVTFLQGFGVREQGRSAPFTADTISRIGSVTKSFSSLLAATLVDAGRLSWETPLADLLPNFAVADPDLSQRLNVADSFCACTGLPRRDWEVVFNGHSLTVDQMLADMATFPLAAAYGERYLYSNQMVAAGGFAAAVSDGGSPNNLAHDYEIALRERVLGPIGMSRSTLALDDVLADGDYATPHGADIAGVFQPMPMMTDDTWLSSVEPSGGLWSTAREMARYVETGLNRGLSPDGVRVVSEENLDRTWQPNIAMPAPGPGTIPAFEEVGQHYALGWVVG